MYLIMALPLIQRSIIDELAEIILQLTNDRHQDVDIYSSSTKAAYIPVALDFNIDFDTNKLKLLHLGYRDARNLCMQIGNVIYYVSML